MLGRDHEIPVRRVTLCTDGSASGDGKRLGAAWAIAAEGRVTVNYMTVDQQDASISNANSSYAEYLAAIMAIETVDAEKHQRIDFFTDSAEVFNSLANPDDKVSPSPVLQVLHARLSKVAAEHPDIHFYKCGNSGLHTPLLSPCHVFAKYAATGGPLTYIRPDNYKIQKLVAPDFKHLCNSMQEPIAP